MGVGFRLGLAVIAQYSIAGAIVKFDPVAEHLDLAAP
jgi:hypothetical protein